MIQGIRSMKPVTPVLLDGEDVNLVQELKKLFSDPQPWLDTPNAQFMGRKPRELLGTEEEEHLRNWIRLVKHGMPT